MLPTGLTVAAAAANGTMHVKVGSSTDFTNLNLVTQGNAAWLAWYDFGGGKDGLYVRQVYPTAGGITKAPASSTVSGGSVVADEPESGEPTPFVATPKGVYAAYCTGYPDRGHLAIWRVGTPRPQLTVTAPKAQHVSLSGAPAARVWLGWYQYDNGSSIRAVRTNMAVTRIGPVRSVAVPHGGSPYRMRIEGTPGKADIIANTGFATGAPSTRGIFQTQVLPALTAAAKPKAVKHTACKKVKITVRDAGDPVQGAKVKAGKARCTTAVNGTCKLKVTPTKKEGKLKIKVTASGYVGTKLTVKRK